MESRQSKYSRSSFSYLFLFFSKTRGGNELPLLSSISKLANFLFLFTFFKLLSYLEFMFDRVAAIMKSVFGLLGEFLDVTYM